MISILFLSNAFSQSALTGGLTGVITDPNNALVSNVTVEITNERTGSVIQFTELSI